MNALQGITDLIETVIYEALGLVVPGLLLLVAVAALFSQYDSHTIVSCLEIHCFSTLIAAYVLGYGIQGMASVGVQILRSLFRYARRCLRCRRTRRCCNSMLERIGLNDPQDTDATNVLRRAARNYWIETAPHLSCGDLGNDYMLASLCYSVLGPATSRLERFQGTKHIARGSTVVTIFSIVAIPIQYLRTHQMIAGDWCLVVGALLICVVALVERTARFSRLSDTMFCSQFRACALRQVDTRRTERE